jgi:glycosyltransferase involved in cell wall biosynthesis
MPRVSIVVPTKNGAQRLPDLFAGLARQTVKDFELVVVDDGSEDDTAAVVEASGLGRVVRSPRSLGPGAASNLGVAHAAADVIAFTDDDTMPAPDWIERGLAAVAASDSGLVAGRIELMMPDAPTTAAMMDFGRGYLNQEQYVAEGFGATANLWARRDVLDLLGGFDEHAAWQTHDRDFGERARIAGITMAYADDAVVAHPTRNRARELARVAFRLGRGGSWLARHGVGAARIHEPEWRRLRYWVPWRTIWGLDRLQRRGFCATRAERARLRVVQYTCLQLPLVAGSLRGTLTELRRGR